MRLPNSYGTVYKLSGKRRRPWIARKFLGYEANTETKRAKANYATIGYFEKRVDAFNALTEYNKDPYDISGTTFADVYRMWSEEHFQKVKETTHYKAAYKIMEPIQGRVFSELKLQDFQNVFDNSGKNTPMLKMAKILISQMYDYAVLHEIVSSSKKDLITYLDVGNSNPKAIVRKIFTNEEIENLWERNDQTAKLLLVMIYTGVRISEILDMKKGNVFLDEKYMKVIEAKTDAGIRDVPIADGILPFITEFMQSKGDNLITFAGCSSTIRKVINKETGHLPHDTRHTFATLGVEAGIDQRVIDVILGHSGGKNIALKVYTHIGLAAKLEAVNKICKR